ERKQPGLEAGDYGAAMLDRLLDERRTFFVNPAAPRPGENSQPAIVVAPVMGVQREIEGALYGIKVATAASPRPRISKLEAQLVQLFASAASTQRAKTEAVRIRTQFEQ